MREIEGEKRLGAVLSAVDVAGFLIELSLISRGEDRGGPMPVKKPEPSLQDELDARITIKAREYGAISTNRTILSAEEVLDLIYHIGKVTDSKSEEDAFEWSTVEGSLQMLRVFREEASIFGVQLSISLAEKVLSSSTAAGDVQLDFRFNTNDAELKLFGRALQSDFVAILGGEDSFNLLSEKLDKKILSIRERGRAPYGTRSD